MFTALIRKHKLQFFYIISVQSKKAANNLLVKNQNTHSKKFNSLHNIKKCPKKHTE